MTDIPTFQNYMVPIVEALRELGGSASINELYEAVVSTMKLTEEQLAIVHDEDKGNLSEVGYRMAWARTYLKKAGYLTNSERGVWALTRKASEEPVDPNQVVDLIRSQYATKKSTEVAVPVPDEETIDPNVNSVFVQLTWRQVLMKKLQGLDSDAFERLCQRILRESGFVEVKVTGRTGDGGIDGIGILRLQRVVSFQVLFQCKKWRETVGAKEIRDFRGAMVGRSDKGLFITTGTFTRGAQEEATRDGAPPIDLIDGEQLVDLLKELRLGVQVQQVESVTVEADWFDEI